MHIQLSETCGFIGAQIAQIGKIAKIVRARPEGLRAKAYFRHLTSSQIGLALKHGRLIG